MLRTLTLAAAALLVVAAPALANSPRSNTNVPFTVLDKAPVMPGKHVFHSSIDWKRALRQAGVTAPDAAFPQVNWTRDMVVILDLGNQPTAGYVARIDRIEEQTINGRRTLVVIYTEQRPNPGDPVAQVLTRPFAAVATRKFNGPVQWVPLNTAPLAPPLYQLRVTRGPNQVVEWFLVDKDGLLARYNVIGSAPEPFGTVTKAELDAFNQFTRRASLRNLRATYGRAGAVRNQTVTELWFMDGTVGRWVTVYEDPRNAAPPVFHQVVNELRRLANRAR